MVRFRTLPHTADIRFKAYGSDYEELFGNAALGFANILYNDAERLIRRARGYKRVVTKAETPEELLVDFLNQILAESNIEKKIFPRVKILKISPGSLEAQLFGFPVDHFDEDVKAVSYHNAEIEETDRGLEATLVLDI